MVKVKKIRQTSYECGKFLKTITLNSCPTAGPIHAGVLPKPALWEEHRTLYPANVTLEAKPETTESEVVIDQVRSLAEILAERSQQPLDLTQQVHSGKLRRDDDDDGTTIDLEVDWDPSDEGKIAAALPESIRF